MTKSRVKAKKAWALIGKFLQPYFPEFTIIGGKYSPLKIYLRKARLIKNEKIAKDVISGKNKCYEVIPVWITERKAGGK